MVWIRWMSNPHPLWSERPRGEPPDVNSSVTAVRTEPPPPLQVLFAQRRPTCYKPAGRAGWGEVPVAPAEDDKEGRNSTVSQTARKTGLQTADISSTTTEPFSSRADRL